MAFDFKVNGKAAHSEAPPHTPLLRVIGEALKLTGTRLGCGSGLCGACMVHIDGKCAFSCQTYASEAAGRAITIVCRGDAALDHCSVGRVDLARQMKAETALSSWIAANGPRRQL
jgi:aerobic-type carbon monoxide dehydrogenase small subunit (CoxS/CutS family)